MHTAWCTYLLHLRAPGQLWMRFWMVGCEKPKKSAPDGTMGTTGLELKKQRAVCVTKMYEESALLTNPHLWAHCTWQTRWPLGGWSGTSGQTRPRWRSEDLLLAQSQTGGKKTQTCMCWESFKTYAPIFTTRCHPGAGNRHFILLEPVYFH